MTTSISGLPKPIQALRNGHFRDASIMFRTRDIPVR